MKKFKIVLYKKDQTWLFDDLERGIFQEPFVMGASELLQHHINEKSLGDKKAGVIVEFSTHPIENHDIRLVCIKKHKPFKLLALKRRFGSHVVAHVKNTGKVKYIVDEDAEPTSGDYIDQLGQKCWLCPAQLKFFGSVADVIYAKILP